MKTHFYRRRVSVTSTETSITLPAGLKQIALKNVGSKTCYFDFDNTIDASHLINLNAGSGWSGEFTPDGSGYPAEVMPLSTLKLKTGGSDTTEVVITGFTVNKEDPVS